MGEAFNLVQLAAQPQQSAEGPTPQHRASRYSARDAFAPTDGIQVQPGTTVSSACAKSAPAPFENAGRFLLGTDAMTKSGPVLVKTPRGQALPRSGVHVLSYNILSHIYIRVGGQDWNQFKYSTDEALSWPNRQPRILQTLQSAHADVMCLQEVVLEWRQDGWNLPEWLDPLATAGYERVVQSRNLTQFAASNLRKVDQEVPVVKVIFFRASELKLLHDKETSMGELIACFETGSKHRFAVANVHLRGSPGSDQIKKAQLSEVLSEIEEYDCENIIAGDFNCDMENDSSELMHVLKEASLHRVPTGKTWFDPWNLEVNEKPKVEVAYDAIWYSSDLVPVATWADATFPQSGLPTVEEPSDHVPVCASFYIKIEGLGGGHLDCDATAAKAEGSQFGEELPRRVGQSSRGAAG